MKLDAIQDLYELTPTQQGILFHALQDQNESYTAQLTCRLRGPLDRAALEQALAWLTERHAALRTSIHWEQLDKPLQMVRREADFQLGWKDLQTLSPEQQEAAVRQLMEGEAGRGFEFEDPPLFRASVAVLGREIQQAIFTYHHVLFDGWTMGLLLRDMLAYYDAARRGTTVHLPSPPAFRGYVVWLQQQDTAAAQAYWRHRLQGFARPTPLPQAFPSPAAASAVVALEHRLSRSETARLRQFAREQRLTVNLLAQAAWAAAFSHLTGNLDIVFGQTVAGRPSGLRGAEAMVGIFINTVPARFRIRRSQGVLDWLQQLQQDQSASQEFEHASLVDIQRCSELPPGTPLFEGLYVFENFLGQAALRDLGGSLEVLTAEHSSRTNYPLNLIVAPEDELLARLTFDRGRISPEDAQRLLARFKEILPVLPELAGQTVGDLPAMSAAERETVCNTWNQTAEPFPAGEQLHHLFEQQAAQAPDTVALVYEDRQFTYRQLNCRANELARRLQSAGVGAEVPVALLMDRSPEVVIGLLAVLKAGGAYLPLDTSQPSARLQRICEQARPHLILTTGQFELQAKQLESGLLSDHAGVIAVDSFEQCEYEQGGYDENPRADSTGANAAYILFTSGSTGEPKGVVVEHRPAVNYVRSISARLGFTAAGHYGWISTVAADLGNTTLLPALCQGGCLHVISEERGFDGHALAAYLERRPLDYLKIVPSHLAALCQAAPLESLLPRQALILGGEAADRKLIDTIERLAPQCTIYNHYGPTETTVGVLTHRAASDDRPRRSALPLGKPIGNTQVYLLDGDLQPVPIGVAGELYVGGANVARGYLGDAALTASRFVPDPFSAEPGRRLYRTGDMARWNAQGQVEFLGRSDHQIKIHGYRIELGEIEDALAQLPGVARAVAVIHTDESGEKQIVAYLASEDQATLDPVALREQLARRLPRYMLPAIFVQLAALPLTSNGKIDRQALPDPHRGGALQRQPGLEQTEHLPPRNEVEAALARIWSEVLGRDGLGVRDNFFELGGHSLLAMQIFSRVRRELQVELPLRELFRQPTIAGLAQAVRQAQRLAPGLAEDPPIVPISREGELPLSFAQERLWFLHEMLPHQAVYNMPAAVRLTGPLDVAALEASLDDIVARHASLRTTFANVDGRPRMHIAPALQLKMPVQRLSSLVSTEREAELQRRAAEEMLAPFDLERGPLLRASLLELSAADHVLLVTMHHIVADGWSVQVLIREVAAIYEARRRREQSPLAPLALQYVDFAAWQRNWLSGKVLESQLEYWKGQLDGITPLHLPTDRPRRPVPSPSGSRYPFVLDDQIAARLAGLARDLEATPFMLHLAVLQILLARYTGQDDIAVGTPVAGRNRAEVEPLVGCFVNTLVIRNRIRPAASFREFLAQVRDASLNAFAHQDIPFERLVDEFQSQRDLSRSPLFQVMFTYQNAPPGDIRLPDGLEMELLEPHVAVAKFDLTVVISERTGQLTGTVEYHPDLYDESTIARLIESYQSLLDGVAEDPDCPVSELPVAGKRERQLPSGHFQEEPVEPLGDATLFDRFLRQARSSPEKTAARYGDQCRTYGQLEEDAARVAAYLATAGVEAGEYAALCAGPSMHLPGVLVGMLRAGAVCVPLDPADPRRTAACLEQVRPRWIVAEKNSLAWLRAFSPQGVLLFEDAFAADTKPPAAAAGQPILPEAGALVLSTDDDDPPRWIEISHAALTAAVGALAEEIPLHADDTVLADARCGTDRQILQLFAPWLRGACTYLLPEEEAASSAALQQAEASLVLTTPARLCELMAGSGGISPRPRVIATGEPLSGHLARRLDAGDIDVRYLYGTTASSGVGAISDVEASSASDGRGAALLRKPLAGMRVYVLDRHLQPVPPGACGELYLAGPALAVGYVGDPRATAASFVPDPFGDTAGARLFRSGDLFRLHADGSLEWIGRMADEPRWDIGPTERWQARQVLEAHPGVAVALLEATVEQDSPPRLVAYVLAENDTLNSEALRDFCKSRLPQYLVPDRIVVCDRFPLDRRGRLQRRHLDAPPHAGSGDGAYFDALCERTNLTKNQLLVWAGQKLQPDATLYNAPFLFTIERRIEPWHLERAIEALVGGADALRTVIEEQGGLPRQRVLPAAPFQLEVVDLSRESNPPAAARRWAEEQGRQTIDLAQGPFVSKLARLAEDRYAWLVVLHHVVVDAWTSSLIYQRVSQLYEQSLSGRLEGPPSLPRYADFLAYQRCLPYTAAYRRAKHYWQGKLANDLEMIDYYAHQPRRTSQVVRVARQLGPDRSARLREIAAHLGSVAGGDELSRFRVVAAILSAYLHRISGNRTIGLGAPFWNRPDAVLQQTIGLMMQVMPLRIEVAGSDTLHTLSSKIFTDFFASARHAHYTTANPPQRKAYDVTLNYHIERMPPFAGAATQCEWLHPGYEDDSLALQVRDFAGTGNITLDFDFNVDLFGPEHREQAIAHFLHMADLLLSNPDLPLREVSLTPADESRQLTALGKSRSDAPSAAPTQPATIVQEIERQAAAHPHAAAVTCGEDALTYEQLMQRAERLARLLQQHGAGPEVRVAIAVSRSIDLVVAVLGVLKSGSAYLPLDAEAGLERLQFMIEDAGVRLLVTERSCSPLTAELSLPAVDIGALPPVPNDDSTAKPLPAANGENLAYVIYTSGSTGQPKGTMVRHAAWLNAYRAWHQAYALQPRWSHLQMARVTFDVFAGDFVRALASGGRLVLCPKETLLDAQALHALLEQEQIDAAEFVPAVARSLIDRAEQSGTRPSFPRLMVVGSDAWFCGEHRRLRQMCGSEVRVINSYGLTEATIDSTFYEGDAAGLNDDAMLPIGSGFAGTDLYLLDRYLLPVPIGVAGELYIGGAGLARGYLNRPSLTAERFVPDPFGTHGARLYRTGDLCHWLPGGELQLLGRVDHQVKIRGFRVELGEIEAALAALPSVKEVAVVARGSATHQRLVAYIATDVQPLDVTRMRAALTSRLPDYMLPAAFVQLEALPRLPSGKLDRRALPEPAEAPTAERDFQAPSTPAEQKLAEIWSEVLQVDRVGVDENFFELGGDSILSIQIVAKANRAGMTLTAQQIFQHQTIGELAAVVTADRRLPAEQEAVTGSVPLTPIGHHFLELQLAEPDHFNQAVMLRAPESLEREALQAALGQLVTHHDALRLRLSHDGARWQQWIADPPPGSEASEWLEQIDLSQLSMPTAEHALAEHAGRLQRALDLRRGPLLRAGLFAMPDGTERLLLIVHHLAVDGVSWRILLEDLLGGYVQAKSGRPIALPPKTTSFKQWSERLVEFARSEALVGEIDHWQQVASQANFPLPCDATAGDNTIAVSDEVRVSLSAEDTAALLKEVPSAYQTQVQEILLAALASALAEWTDGDAVLLDLEGHGREELFEQVDLSRTVGWFTTIYPVRLELPRSLRPDSGAVIKSVKEQLRRIPRSGIGYGLLRYLRGDDRLAQTLAAARPEVGFNYLGRLDGPAADNAGFEAAEESPGPMISPQTSRPHLIDIGGGVQSGRLQMVWTFSRNRHRRQTIDMLADRFITVLRRLIQHCCSSTAGGVTPADFPLANLDQGSLDKLVGRGRNVEDIYPLSALQQGMLYHSLFAAEAGMYFEQFSCTLHGELDPAAFRQAWEQVLARHGILRTRFAWEGLERPLQIVQRRVDLPWHADDWSDCSAAVQQERLGELLAADSRRGFDLSDAPLMRMALIRVSSDAWRFVWSHHHLLIDGWSVPILLTEVMRQYETIRWGGRIALDPVPPFRRYIEWLERQPQEQAAQFWRDYLQGFTAPTALAIESRPENQRREVQSTSVVQATFAPEQTAAIEQFARRSQLTLSTLVQGAWALLLARYSGEQDVVFGVTVSGRSAPLAGIESMVGLLINTLPVRAQVDARLPALRWMAAIQENTAHLRQFEHSPLVEAKRASDVPGELPLFESLVVFENYPVNPALRQAGMQVAVEDVRLEDRTNFPLTLIASADEQLSLKLHYDAARFDEAAIGNLIAHLQTLLTAMASAGEARVGDLPMLTAPERRQVVEEFNRTAVDFDLSQCLQSRFEAQAARTPDAIAVVVGQASLTYRELDERANRLAWHLQSLGVRPDCAVGVLAERSAEMVIALYAILKAGGAYLPLDPEYPRQRLANMLEDSQAAIILAQQHLLDRLPEQQARLICFETNAGQIARHPATRPRCSAQPDHLAYVIFTSGSTGRPKGSMISHRAICNRLLWMQERYGLTPADRVLQKTPFSFDVSVWEFFWPLMVGARLVVARAGGHKDNGYLVELIEQQRITTLHFVPSMLQAFLEEPNLAHIQVAPRRVICSGEALPVELVERFREQLPATELHNLYGPTEAAVDVTAWECPRQGAIDVVPIGRPISGVRTYILDRQQQPVPIGVPGELHLAGVQLARGYLNRPDLSAERFIPDPLATTPGERMYRTGDLCRWLPDGNIEFLGRIDFQVKLRGLRIELGEIESALLREPSVRECVVVAREDTPGDVRLVAYLVGRGGSPIDVDSVRTALHACLPEYMVPGSFVCLDSLPLTASGKINRRVLPAPQWSRQHADDPYTAPQTELESRLAEIWSDVLSVPQVGREDNFFRLGGHSLLATRLVSRVRAQLHVDLPLRGLFDRPTIAQMADLIGQAQTERDDPIRPADRSGDLPLSFSQQRLWFLEQLTPGDAVYNMPAALRLRGPLDVQLVEQTLIEIVRRHEVLRTSFISVDGEPQQRIARQVKIEVPCTDLTRLAVEQREAEAARLSAEDAGRPFDLGEAPLLRVSLLRLAAEEHVVLINMHHIVSDGWSVEVLLREFAALYGALAHGQAHSLPALPVQYADYALWQRERFTDDFLKGQVAFWRKQLAGAATLELPTSRPRPEVVTFAGRTHRFLLPSDSVERLLQLGEEEESSAFMVLLTAFQVLLSRYSGQEDIVVGTPVAGRNRAEIEGLIGFFVNNVVLRVDLSGTPSGREVVRRVREATLEALAHQELPFERLVDALGIRRDLSRAPLFQVAFALQRDPAESLTLPSGLTVEPLERETAAAKCDLTLYLRQRPDKLDAMIEYNRDLFDAELIEQMAGHYAQLVEQLAAQPDEPVADLPLPGLERIARTGDAESYLDALCQKTNLTKTQLLVWAGQQLDREQPLYNLGTLGIIHQAIDVERFERALQAVVQGSDALRSKIIEEDGIPRSEVVEELPWRLEYLDLSGEANPQATAREIAQQHCSHAIALEGPLFDTLLMKLADDCYAWYWATHHIIGDAWSHTIACRRVADYYRSQSDGPLGEVPALPRFADYVAFEKRQTHTKRYRQAREYYRQLLDSEIEPLEFYGTARPQTTEVARVNHRLGAALTGRLKHVAAGAVFDSASENLSRYQLFAAAMLALIHRLTGHGAVTFGTPIANRRKQFRDTIGLLMRAAPVRVEISDRETFASLARKIGRQMNTALRNQHYVTGNPQGRRAYDVTINYHTAQVTDFAGGSMHTEWLHPGYELDLLALQIHDFDSQGELVLGFDFNCEAFPPERRPQTVQHFLRILQALLENPQTPLGQVDLLTPEEAHSLAALAVERPTDIEERPAIDGESVRTVAELIERHARRVPAATAVVCEEKRLTYAELNARANQLAQRLISQGAGPEVSIGICLERGIELPIAVLAVLKAGATYVPLDPAQAAERQRLIVRDVRPPLIITTAALARPLADLGTELLELDTEALELAEMPTANLPPRAVGENMAYIIYTSGSTGRPKGVVVRHASLLAAYRAWEGAYRLEQTTAHLQMANFTFDVFAGDFVRALCPGKKLVLCPQELLLDAESLYQLMQREQIDAAEFVPVVLRLLVDYLQVNGRSLDFMRLVAVGSDAWYGQEHQKLLALCRSDTLVVDSYGVTEATIDSSYFAGDAALLAPGRLVPVGRPLGTTRLYVLDHHQMPVPIGIAGELYIAGSGLARGYLGKSDQTADRFLPDPFASQPGERMYRTGDLCRWGADGQLELIGRADSQVKIRGYRIELAEIETAIADFPGVDKAVVTVVGGAKDAAARPAQQQQRLVGYLVPRADASISISALRESLAARLPEYMVPATFMELAKLPLLPSGKIDRKSLPAPDLSRSSLTGDYVAPRSPLEERLAEIWSSVLGVERVGVQDNFFALGGHSLLATQLVSRVRDAFEVELPLRRLFESPTIATLAEAIQDASPAAQAPAIVPADRNGRLPLSFAQERLWFLDRLLPGRSLYNMPAAVRVKGPLELPALQDAVAAIIRRHEVLRTTFGEAHGQPYQVIHQAPRLPLQFEDVSHLPVERRDAEARRLGEAAAAQPFDLSAGPLLRAVVLRLDAEEHVIVFVVHHIVFDGWSTAVFLGELAAAYAGQQGNGSSRAQELPIQYADYAQWQRDHLAGEVLANQLRYWKDQLGALPPLELPTDRPRPAVQSFRGAAYRLRIPQPLSADIRQLARESGGTLFTVLLAAWEIVLSRYARQDDFAVGTAVAGRSRMEIEQLIGFFVNSLVLRADLSGNPSFRELHQRVRETTLAAQAHADVPFEQVVEAIQPDRDMSRPPLFSVMFVLQNMPLEELHAPGGLSFTPVEIEAQSSKLDLALNVSETDQGLTCHFEYSTDLFDAETIGRLAEHFQQVLRAITADPDQPAGEIALLTPPERDKLLDQWSQGPDIAGDSTLEIDCAHQRFEAQVRRTPDAVAVDDGRHRLTYRELDEAARRLAGRLTQRGVEPEVRVGLCLDRQVELVIGLLAIWKAGGVVVPLDPGYPADRLRYQLADSGAAVLLTGRTLAQGELASLCDEFSGQVVLLAGSAPGEGEELPDASYRLDQPLPANAAYVIYTSGSTGRPKGVVVSHASFALSQHARGQYYQAPPARLALLSSIAFDSSLAAAVWVLQAGGTLLIPQDGIASDPGRLARLVEQQAISHFVGLPSLYEMLLSHAADEQLTSLRAIVTGGESLPVALVRRHNDRLADVPLYNEYGPTEGTVWCTVEQSKLQENRAVVPIGRPIPGCRVYVLDRLLQPVASGVPGELYLAGDTLARGYQARPDQTAQRFLPEPWSGIPGARMYATGDLCRWLSDGRLEFLGRIDQQVKIRGYRIELGEIEVTLAEHPAVREAAVLAAGEQGNERLVAFLVPAASSPPAAVELREHLRQSLPEYMLPASLIPLPEMPRTAGGKFDRQALARLASQRGERATAYVAPRNDLEASVAEVIADVLQIEQVGVHDNFFELGGHSMAAVRAVADIEERFGKQVPLAGLFRSPTVEQLARLIEGSLQGEDTCLVPLRSAGNKSPFFCVHPATGFVLSYQSLVEQLDPEQPVYGLQAVGLMGEASPLTQIEAMAARYIESIRTVQPRGSYLLGGHSLGGVIAVEMAIQLRAAGEQVNVVAVMDASARALLEETDQADAELDEVQWALDLAAALEQYAGIRVELTASELDPLQTRERLELLHTRLVAARRTHPDGANEGDFLQQWLATIEAAGVGLLENLLRVMQAHLTAIHNYRPARYDGSITLLAAEESAPGRQHSERQNGHAETQPPADYGWQRVSTLPVQVMQVPGDHLSMMALPHVRTLARGLQALLDRAARDDEALPAQMPQQAGKDEASF